MRDTPTPSSNAAGFSLVELMVAMGLVLIVMAGTMTTLTDAYRASDTARNTIDVNNNLRIGTDLITRDLIQVGQALPTGRRVEVPSGTSALLIQRPHPEGSPETCTEWPTGTVTIQAVTPGPGCGPTIGGVATDMITTLSVDSTLDAVPVVSYSQAGRTATVALPAQAAGGVDISASGPDDIRVGDLIMFVKGSQSTLVYVTAVDGVQTITFAAGDPMNLNQVDAGLTTLAGTWDDLSSSSPTGAYSFTLSRIRMISYYLDNTLEPTTPRLIRHMNWGDPDAAVNERGRTVAFGVENLQFTYDMVNGTSNPASVRFVAADLDGTGRCAPSACSTNQIRKVNVYLSARSEQRLKNTNNFVRNALSSQVALRSLALVDRYR